MVASCTPSTPDLACNSGMCPGQELNRQPFGLRDNAQPTELHQPRPDVIHLIGQPANTLSNGINRMKENISEGQVLASGLEGTGSNYLLHENKGNNKTLISSGNHRFHRSPGFDLAA